MAITLTLRLTTKGQNLKGRLAIQCTTKDGTKTLKRHYKLIQGLKSPVFTPEYWNEKQGLFIAGETAAHNNQVTKTLLDELNAMIASTSYADGKQLFADYEYAQTHIKTASALSLAEYVESILEAEKERTTTNYEQYNTMLNKLRGHNRKHHGHHFDFEPASYHGIPLADIPIREINNRHFEALGEWIKTKHEGKGYRNLMTTFKAVVSRAKSDGLTEVVLDYDWRKHAPVKAVKQMTAKQRIAAKGRSITILSVKEFKRFVALDVLASAPKQRHFQDLAQLYKDTVLLMYYTMSRPTDVISLKWVENYDEENHRIVYTPRKLAHRPLKNGLLRDVVVDLPKQAIEIINRYKGQSKGGYLLPLPLNETNWDLTDVSDFRKWNTRIKNVEARINLYLKKWAEELSLEVTDLSMYDFRHSAITHAVNKGGNIFEIAQLAGTSVDMIAKHYYNAVRK